MLCLIGSTIFQIDNNKQISNETLKGKRDARLIQQTQVDEVSEEVFADVVNNIDKASVDESSVDVDMLTAMEVVIHNQKLIYNGSSQTYTPEGASYEVVLFPYGFNESGKYEIRIGSSDYPLSVYSYCYVDLESKSVTIEP